jgi:GntR family transcriptional regulator, transcriptional repressor for pyruvate dehydrogenase complex
VKTEKPENTNIANTVYRDLTRQILSGALLPGSRLPGERELAQTYKTNRNTLREAVRRLEQARLVTVRHGQGVTVSDFRRTGTMELLSPLLECTSDYLELALVVRDLLPARLIDQADIQRLGDITDRLISATELKDTQVIAKGFQSWLDALIDSAHSVALRWVANPFLESYGEVLERFPTLWVLDSNFADHLRRFHQAFEAGDVELALGTLRAYYERIDGVVAQSFERIAHAVGPVRPREPDVKPKDG